MSEQATLATIHKDGTLYIHPDWVPGDPVITICSAEELASMLATRVYTDRERAKDGDISSDGDDDCGLGGYEKEVDAERSSTSEAVPDRGDPEAPFWVCLSGSQVAAILRSAAEGYCGPTGVAHRGSEEMP